MKKLNFTRILKTVFILTAVLLSCSCLAKKGNASGSPDMAEAFIKAGLRLINQPVSARDFSLHLISASDGVLEETVTLSKLKGKVVFLNFWATWCGPCRAEMPSMESLYNRFKDKGFEMLAVNFMEKETDVLAFLNEINLSFPILFDNEASAGAAYGIQALPTTFIIDREGNIVSRLVGSIDWDTPAIHTALEMLLDS